MISGLRGMRNAKQSNTLLNAVVILTIAGISLWQLVVHLSPALPGLTAAEALLQCYNDATVPANRSDTFEGFLSGVPANLVLHKVLWSVHPSHIPLTVFTMATLSRLHALEALCSSWQGPLAAAVYLPLEAAVPPGGVNRDVLTAESRRNLEEAEKLVSGLFDRSESRLSSDSHHGDGCRLRVLLLYELLAFPQDSSKGGNNSVMYNLLPINTLRNAALLAADTPLVLMADTDLLLARGLSDELADEAQAKSLQAAAAAQAAFILPTFETSSQLRMDQGQGVAALAISGDKENLKQLVAAKDVHPFAIEVFEQGHRCTNFTKWYETKEPYTTQYTKYCEPWYIVDRRLNHEYDVRFRGYGWNKVQQVTHLAKTNFTFKVHPKSFLVHRPHASSKALNTFWEEKDKSGRFFLKITDLLDQAFKHTGFMPMQITKDLDLGVHRSVTDAHTQHCRAKLSWWRR